MAKTYLTMQNNVANMVQDTTTDMKTLIKVWLNDKYRDIARRCMWSALIDDDKTLETTASTATIDLPSDFDEEVAVIDIATGDWYERYGEGQWWRERWSAYNTDSIPAGTPARYVILREAGKIKLDPAPNSVYTIAIPYKKTITDLSGDSDTVDIADIEYAMELGATADAWSYKRQFQKASYYQARYEQEVARRVGQERSAINQVYQRISSSYKMPGIQRLTGDQSYDSI